jgi:two-component system OmpR family response regulator
MTDRKRILLVDDEPGVRFAIDHYFRAAGYDVDLAASGEEARAALAGARYDVVLIDVQLSGLEEADGLDVIRMIRDGNLAARTIVLTGNASGAVRAEALRLGAGHVLEKPVPLRELAQLVAALTFS